MQAAGCVQNVAPPMLLVNKRHTINFVITSTVAVQLRFVARFWDALHNSEANFEAFYTTTAASPALEGPTDVFNLQTIATTLGVGDSNFYLMTFSVESQAIITGIQVYCRVDLRDSNWLIAVLIAEYLRSQGI
jgi:hypothetical protein